MIPRHRPPFGVRALVATALEAPRHLDIEGLEAGFAAASEMEHAVLLPSARAGIYWSLEAVGVDRAKVVGPAFTCPVVHEAMARSQGVTHLVDCADDALLMDPAALDRIGIEGAVLVLCELFGHAYDLDAGGLGGGRPRLRIIDMAMTVPLPRVVGRITNDDIAIFSFGPGKCLDAGAGGIAFTGDGALADEVRARRDSFMTTAGIARSLMRNGALFLRTVAHDERVNGPARRARQAWLAAVSPLQAGNDPRAGWAGLEPRSGPWRFAPTGLQARLARRNLEQAECSSNQRVGLAETYREELQDLRTVRLPPVADAPLSHFTVRVEANHRDRVREILRCSGVDTGRLYGFPPWLSPGDYPRAFTASSEVINLPLDPTLTLERGRGVAMALRSAMADVEREAPAHER